MNKAGTTGPAGRLIGRHLIDAVDDSGYLAAALWMLGDGKRLSRLAEAARQTMLPHSWAGVVASFESVAREAIAG